MADPALVASIAGAITSIGGSFAANIKKFIDHAALKSEVEKLKSRMDAIEKGSAGEASLKADLLSVAGRVTKLENRRRDSERIASSVTSAPDLTAASRDARIAALEEAYKDLKKRVDDWIRASEEDDRELSGSIQRIMGMLDVILSNDRKGGRLG